MTEWQLPIYVLAYVILGCLAAYAIVASYVGIRDLLVPLLAAHDDDDGYCAGDCACNGFRWDCYCNGCRAIYGEEAL